MSLRLSAGSRTSSMAIAVTWQPPQTTFRDRENTVVNGTSKKNKMEFHSYHLKHFQSCKWLRPCSVYNHSLLNSNGRKICVRKRLAGLS